jgi:hypothetical protein
MIHCLVRNDPLRIPIPVQPHAVPATTSPYVHGPSSASSNGSSSILPRPKKDYSEVVQHLRMSRADPMYVVFIYSL